MNAMHENRCQKDTDKLKTGEQTSNFMLVVLLHLELAGSFRSTPADNRDKFTPPLPVREKLSMGTPWTPISGEIECWEEKKKNEKKQRKKLQYVCHKFLLKLTSVFQIYRLGFLNLDQSGFQYVFHLSHPQIIKMKQI
jgi:hypothetical protein